MTESDIKSADAILKCGGPDNIALKYCLELKGNSDITEFSLEYAAHALNENGFIELEQIENKYYYKLKLKGFDYMRNKKSYTDYLNEISVKEMKQRKKEDIEELRNELQIKDLEVKVSTLNDQQIDFWKAQKQKSKETTKIAIIALVFSFVTLLITLLKVFGYLPQDK